MATAAEPSGLRQRLRRWIDSRHPTAREWKLTQRTLYVLPSGAGWMLAITAALLLVASINYQINLGFLFTFMLAGVGFVSILVAHSNLRGVTLRAQSPKPLFANQPALVPVYLEQDNQRARFAIALYSKQDTNAAMVDIQPAEPIGIELSVGTLPRGRHHCPQVTIETRYPIGAFRVWSIWKPDAPLLIYPVPEPHPPALPQNAEVGASGPTSSASPSFEMEGFRSYQRGDPMKSILWKKTATAMVTGSDNWVRRDQTQLQVTELWLDHAATGLQHPEAILSRLCAWVLLAEEQGAHYGLRLPHLQIEPSHGSAHRHRCLEALALS